MQSAYRKGYISETVLLKEKCDIFQKMENEKVTCLVLLKLSAAFDTVDFNKIFNRLLVSYGGTVLHCFECYLTE